MWPSVIIGRSHLLSLLQYQESNKSIHVPVIFYFNELNTIRINFNSLPSKLLLNCFKNFWICKWPRNKFISILFISFNQLSFITLMFHSGSSKHKRLITAHIAIKRICLVIDLLLQIYKHGIIIMSSRKKIIQRTWSSF